MTKMKKKILIGVAVFAFAINTLTFGIMELRDDAYQVEYVAGGENEEDIPIIY